MNYCCFFFFSRKKTCFYKVEGSVTWGQTYFISEMSPEKLQLLLGHILPHGSEETKPCCVGGTWINLQPTGPLRGRLLDKIAWWCSRSEEQTCSEWRCWASGVMASVTEWWLEIIRRALWGGHWLMRKSILVDRQIAQLVVFMFRPKTLLEMWGKSYI